MPGLLVFLATSLAAVVTTGALLDRRGPSRLTRALVWTALGLLLLISSLVYFLVMMSLNWHSC